MKPTIGRIVHLITKDRDALSPLPAIIVRVNDLDTLSTIDVQAFPSVGGCAPDSVYLQFRSFLPHESEADAGQRCWRWPPRE